MTMYDSLHVLLRHAWVFMLTPAGNFFFGQSFADSWPRNGIAPSSQCTMSTKMCTMSSNGQQAF